MAATSSAAAVALVSLPFPTSTSSSSRVSARSHRNPSPRPFSVSPIRCSSASPNLSAGAPALAPTKPQIELEFVGPKPGADGSYPVDRAAAASGEKLLRNVMNDNRIELYAAYGKVMNCGGGGSCGTCIVEIIDGKELLNERTNTENRYLKKKPESWRLACQTIVGNKENSGKVVVQRLPQWKK
ncbi:photosynthetic NDH subunit of subcomplex B 3, chloroplastic-like isoform X4 [Phragmites australis]|uniref:photosynthetic NDH subunit of subcomplex B 3, chloroplastic-like isoform X4 n=1 Tax=Phragmites australis TaxID=29695 RepID=UPI002D7A2713|nr:photosynthetic NDH subunit of subcomplex B 3, chloroplastic-like isoform X4 [Phragmites australis]